MSPPIQTTADQTSLAAAILAAGAFVISFLQLILQYISSSESRSKCNRAAINFSAKDVTHRWSFTNWKLKVYYPELDMSCFKILESMEKAWMYGIDYSSIQDFSDGNKTFWHILTADDVPGWQHISDELTALACRTHQGDIHLLKDSDLPWKNRVRFWWWRFLHPLKLIRRPRASWSQLISSFGIRETSSLKRRVLDADTIHFNMDVPFQYVELSQLGLLAVVMGFKDININIVDRTFHATGRSGTITTQEIQNIGKVLRFDGDTFAINYTVVRANDVSWTRSLVDMSCGAMYFGRYVCGVVHLPVEILSEAIGLDLSTDDFDKAITDYIKSEEDEDGLAGNLPKEAHSFQADLKELQRSRNKKELLPEHLPASPGRTSGTSQELAGDSLQTFQSVDNSDYRALLSEEMARWQKKTKLQVPTIFLAAMFCSVHGLVVGFPSRQLLKPFLPLWQLEAKEISQHLIQNFAPCTNLQRAIRAEKIVWLKSEVDWLSTGAGAAPGGLFSWGICSFAELYSQLPDGVRRDLLEFTFCCTERDQEKRIHSRDLDTAAKGRASSIFMPHTIKLLSDFRPHHWKDQLTGKQKFDVLKQWSGEHLLWAQIMLIDIAIRLVISGDSEKIDDSNTKDLKENDLENGNDCAKQTKAESWGLRDVRLVRALANCWRLDENNHAMEQRLQGQDMVTWNLIPSLENFDVIQCRNGEKAPQRRERLAELLKIRALFVVALFMLGPDTSDIYLAADYSIHLPMI